MAGLAPTPYHAGMMAKRLILLLGVLLVGTADVSAQESKTVLLEQLTWIELRDRVRSGTTTIIVPIGGTEQNGPYMGLGKHNVRVQALSEKIAAKLGNALVAPVLAYVPEGRFSPPTAHMRFPGTITIPDDVFEKILESAARSFKLHGFRDVVFLGDHGGYQKDIAAVADRLNREWAKTPIRAHAPAAYYQASESDYAQLLRRQGFRDEEIGTHAGLLDTSLMLALDPRLVRMDQLRSATRIDRAEGVYGDPRRASAELGQMGVDAIVSRTVDAIRQAVVRR
jgi:creatinine amidohydrolase/Fe(II)-dependent formamide hydrolase-like protein